VNIVIYKLDSGQITKNVACPKEMVSLQYDHETENYIEHDVVDDSLFYVVDGEVQPIP
jgi:hypothetical protein